MEQGNDSAREVSEPGVIKISLKEISVLSTES